MRISLISDTWPPQVNGAALTLAALADGLAMRGHAVDVVRPRPAGAMPPHDGATALPGQEIGNGRNRDGNGRIDHLLVPGCRLPRYPGLRLGWPARGRLRRHWLRHRPDAVYIATEGPLGWAALGLARHLSIPVVTGYHTRFDDYLQHYGLGLLTPLARGWLRRFHNRASATVVPSPELAAQLACRGFANVALIGRSVDTVRFSPARRDPELRRCWGVGDDEPVVLHVGRLAAEKNLELLDHAWRAIASQRPGARLVVVGDGPERQRLQAGNPQAHFTGTLLGDDLARHYASADLFLFPSLSETFGNVTLEAMASGLAVVAFAYGAAGQHITGPMLGRAIACPGDATVPASGPVPPAGHDHDAGVDAFIDAALELAMDRPLRQAIGRRARQQMCRLAVRNDVAAGHLALFRRLGGAAAGVPGPARPPGLAATTGAGPAP